MGYLWVIGVVLVATASAGSTVGIILMKKSFGDTGEHKDTNAKLIWVAGLAMMVTGAILDFVAFGFAAQSLIAPLGSITLLCNVILSPLILGETVAKSDWVASGIIALGCTLAIAFGDHETKTYKFDDLMALYDNPAVSVYLPAVGASVAGMFLYIYHVEEPARNLANTHHRQITSDLTGIQIGTNTLNDPELGVRMVGVPFESSSSEDEVPGGFLVGFNGRDTLQHDSVSPELDREPLSPTNSPGEDMTADKRPCQVATDGLDSPDSKDQAAFQECLSPQAVLPFIPKKVHMLHGFCYAAAGGLAGSCSVLFGKSVAEIIKPGFTDGDGTAWGRYETYLILVAMGFTLYVQMKGLNGGLGYHPAVFIVPVYQTCWILGSIVGGGVYFKEFANMTTLGMIMFCLGTAICIAGVFVLTYCRWDAEMEKFRREMGLAEDDNKDQVEKLDSSGEEATDLGKCVAPTLGLPSMGGKIEGMEPKEDDPNAIHSADPSLGPNSPSPSHTRTSHSNRPLLPPLPSPKIDITEAPEDSRAARNALRKKRMLRKKQDGLTDTKVV